jgi:hypothetical protein
MLIFLAVLWWASLIAIIWQSEVIIKHMHRIEDRLDRLERPDEVLGEDMGADEGTGVLSFTKTELMELERQRQAVQRGLRPRNREDESA